MQHRPRRLVGADLELALQRQRGNPVLLGCEQPARGEPARQRRPRAVKDRAHRRRGALPAGRAPHAAIGHPPASGVPAVRADEPTRPAQPLEVVSRVPNRCSTGPKSSASSRCATSCAAGQNACAESGACSQEGPRMSLPSWPEFRDVARLLVSELATNASVLGSLLLSEFFRGGTRPIAVRARSALATAAESRAICSVLSSAR